MRLKPDTGATLIEILVVISVMAIMFAIGLPAISTQIANAELHQGTREVVSVLRRVRAAAINQQAPHYVKLESNQLQVYRCVPNSDFTDCTWTAFENPVVLPNSVTINFSASDFPELPDTPAGGSIQNVPQGAVYFSPRGGYPSTGTPGEEYEINIDSVRNSTSRTVTVVRETGHIEIESP
ncbi:MAG: pilus assembly FimT family protein [Acidimicrobiia bacterium]